MNKSNDKRRRVVKMIVRLSIIVIFLFQWQIPRISSETVHGCTNNNQRSNKTSITLSCANNGYILVQNLTFGVHKTTNPTCSYQSGDCTTRTTSIGMECNGQQHCQLDLNPQYLHICSQYSDYMVLDYLCLPGESLAICDNRLILTRAEHRLLIRSPNYPNEYDNSLNCSCEIATSNAEMKFLDFVLEERDEMNLCSRDYLQIANQSYCDSTIDPIIHFNASIQLRLKTNDVITRKGFWLMIQSDQSMQVACRNSFDSPFPTTNTKILWTPLTTTTNSSSSLHSPSRYTLSFVLLFTIIFVVILLLLNLLLIILCWKQRRSKESINSTTRPFFCSKRSETSSSSSITYGEPSLDVQKRQTTSTTTATTGIYEDPNDILTLQRQQQKPPSFYFQHRHAPKTFCPIILPPCPSNPGYNPMIHYPIPPMHCHFNQSAQTFYPLDSQHIYETIQDGQCPYQRLAATLRRQKQCTCYCTHNEQKLAMGTDEPIGTVEPNPETLV